MLTLRYIEEMMVNALRTPLNLCERLGLKPTERQYELLQQLEEQPAKLDLELGDNREVLNAVAVYTLWRTFAHQGARATVIAANRERAAQFMGFLHRVTTEIDPALNSAVRWTRWNVMKIGPDAGHELRLVPNQPVCAAGRHASKHTIVILGAGDADPAFVETMKALEDGNVGDGGSLLRLW